MSEVNTCVGSCDPPKPNGANTNQPSNQAINNPLSNSGNQAIPLSPQTNAKSIMRSSLITTKTFSKGAATQATGPSFQLRQLSAKMTKPAFSTSTSTGAKMINLQQPLVDTSGPTSSCPPAGSGDSAGTNFASVASNLVSPTTTVTAPIGQPNVPHQASIGALVGGTGAIGNATIKGFKTVVGGHTVTTGKVDSGARYYLNSKPQMTVNITQATGGTGKVRFAPVVNFTTATGPLTVADNQQQSQQHKVILQQANQTPSPAGTVVVSTTKVQPTNVTITSVASASPSPTGAGSGSIRLSLPRRFGTQQPGSQTVLPAQQNPASRIFQACGMVPSSVGGNLPNLAPRMILASPGATASASAVPVQTSTSTSVQNLQQSLNTTSQGSALTVSQQDLQRLQQSGAIAPVVSQSTSQSAGGASMLTVRSVNTATTVASAQQALNASDQQSSAGSTNQIEQALMMASPSSCLSSLQTNVPQQPFIPRPHKRAELTLAAHPSGHLKEGTIGPGRIITLHQSTQNPGSAQQITLQAANMTVAAHVTQQTSQPSTILTPQLVHQPVTPGTVVIQPGPVRPEASNSPMRKRARKQQLQTVATPVTTPMTVEEEEEQKRKTMYMMTADRHAMSRISSGGQVTQQTSNLSTVSSSHNPSPGSVSDPISSSVRLGSRSELVEVASGPVGSHSAMSTPAAVSISSSGRYRANSAQSSSSSSGRSTPRLVTSHHRKRHSPRSQGSVAAKLSRKAVLHTSGSRSSSRRSRVNKVPSSSSNALATASTSDTESDVEASVSVVGVRESNVCSISGLLGNDDFHSPPTVTSNVRFGSSPLPQEQQHIVMTSNASHSAGHRRPQSSASSQASNLRKRVITAQSGMRSANMSSGCVRQAPSTAMSYSQNSAKQSVRRISCEHETDSHMEEDTVLDDDLEVDPVEEEVEAADDEEMWCEDVGEVGMIESVSCDDRFLPQVAVVQHQRFGTSPDLSSVGANVAVSSTDVNELPDSGIVPTSSEVNDGGTVVTGFRRMRITQNYNCNWKPRSGHFQSYQDVRERKNDKKNALANLVVSLAEKKKISTMHWEVLCLLTSFTNMKSTEKDKLRRLEKISENLRQAKSAPEVLRELVKGNLQRCRLMIETINTHSETLQTFVSEQSKDLSIYLTPVESYCFTNNSSSSSHPVYALHSRHRHSGGGGSNCSRTGSGAHRNLS